MSVGRGLWIMGYNRALASYVGGRPHSASTERRLGIPRLIAQDHPPGIALGNGPGNAPGAGARSQVGSTSHKGEALFTWETPGTPLAGVPGHGGCS